MSKNTDREHRNFVDSLMAKDPELLKEFQAKYMPSERESVRPQRAPATISGGGNFTGLGTGRSGRVISLEGRAEMQLESIVAHFRPVLVIRDNKLVMEFIGREVEVWKQRLEQYSAVLNKRIPSVGRIEVNNNALYNWAGTGWLVDKDIIVTNRHVASIFCQNRAGFSFKAGFPKGFQSARIDFLEEDLRNNSFEFEVDSVIWMADNDERQPDIAFLKLKTSLTGPILAAQIPLASSVTEGQTVVTIGYPARDPDFPDQDLVQNVFQNVYDKKRLAPGEIRKVSEYELEHDCSTLGGNSGSAVIDLATGEAVGLHFAGVYMKTNYAVPAAVVSRYLIDLQNKKLPGMRINENIGNKPSANTRAQTPATNVQTFEFNIPIRITIEVGGQVVAVQGAQPAGGGPEAALVAARQQLSGQEGIREVRLGYRFRNGWITDERVIVVTMDNGIKPESGNPDGRRIPSEFLGIGVDIRSADLLDELEDMNISSKEEAVPVAGRYQEPPDLSLDPVTDEVMDAIFHVSPDAGFPNLRDFIGRIEHKLVATMYEWEVNHVSDALVDAIKKAKGSLKMVTQREGTKEAVADISKRLGKRFEHEWASVGKGKLVPKAYHIKVASRDNEEFWLSSGNWKDSNQPDISPAADGSTAMGPLRDHNREWHVIIKNPTLAKLFADYIEWDFSEAQRVPLEEALAPEPIWLLVPEIITEARGVAKYFPPLFIKQRKLNIQPLLTPDRDSRGRRMFLVFATSLISKAKSSICIQNQSFSLLDDNNEAFEKFFNVLKRKQDEGVSIRVIFRDLAEFHNSNMKIIEKLKDLGLDTDNVRVQKKCHTKAILVDTGEDEGEENAAVLFGSHNLTNTGALFNRDASLLVRDAEVARYFQEIFEFDWQRAANQIIEAPPARIAGKDEAPPAGFTKILLTDLLNSI